MQSQWQAVTASVDRTDSFQSFLRREAFGETIDIYGSAVVSHENLYRAAVRGGS